jgi:hypothetical protein
MNTSSRFSPILEQLGEEAAGAADERQALAILLGTRGLADEASGRRLRSRLETTRFRVSESGQRSQIEAWL